MVSLARLRLVRGRRSRIRHEQGQIPRARHVCQACHQQNLFIRAISTTFKLHNIPQPWLTALLQIRNGNQNLKINIPTVVKWLTPPKGRLKQNVDGAFKMTSGEAGGGGILCDHKGNMCCAFAKTYHGLNSSLTAEALALRDGLSICCSRGVSDVLVETDSLNLLQIVTRQLCCPWELVCILQDVAVKTMNLKAEIIHGPREANK
ncbi:hypothetical protein Taro_056562, partial [Colocasia esculenta]|nr:hypothetical protein [Colocasia esculenta]